MSMHGSGTVSYTHLDVYKRQTIQIGNFILTEATLSFLGVGVPITEPSLGLLVKTGFDVLFSGLWWASVFPGLYIMLIVFGINLLGDFLRDELNPNLK